MIPLSMEFSRQAYWNELPFPSPGDLPDPGIEPGSLALQADFYHLSHLGSFYTHAHTHTHICTNTMEYYSVIKTNEILPFMTTWMKLEGIMLNKISQEKDKYHMVLLVCGILKTKKIS